MKFIHSQWAVILESLYFTDIKAKLKNYVIWSNFKPTKGNCITTQEPTFLIVTNISKFWKRYNSEEHKTSKVHMQKTDYVEATDISAADRK